MLCTRENWQLGQTSRLESMPCAETGPPPPPLYADASAEFSMHAAAFASEFVLLARTPPRPLAQNTRLNNRLCLFI